MAWQHLRIALIDPNVAALTSSRRMRSATRLGDDMLSEAVPRSGVSRSFTASSDASCDKEGHQSTVSA